MNEFMLWLGTKLSSQGELLTDKFPDQQDNSYQFEIAGGVYNEVKSGFPYKGSPRTRNVKIDQTFSIGHQVSYTPWSLF